MASDYPFGIFRLFLIGEGNSSTQISSSTCRKSKQQVVPWRSDLERTALEVISKNEKQKQHTSQISNRNNVETEGG